jgi:branched-chain amino acid transport system ATP-binding protein
VPDFLTFEDVTAGYAGTVVLERVSFALPTNSSLALLGRNGVGKTTLLSTIMGLTLIQLGRVRFKGRDLAAVPTHLRVVHGIGLVPQEREIFRSLTVQENLEVAVRPGAWTPDHVYDLFPSLKPRRGNYGDQLSGGEQQMLAVGRALVGNPELLLLDEPFEGLAPVIVDQLIDGLDRIRRGSPLAIILVEHHAELALDFAETALVLDRGQVVWQGGAAALRGDPETLGVLVGLEERPAPRAP